MRTALVIGGTGPTGPTVVEGLLDRGFRVSIMHTGQHEASFSRYVEHIHADPHFREPITRALEDRTFDVVVAMYGRLRLTGEAAAGRTERFVCVSGSGGYPAHDDPAWGDLGAPLLPDETGPWQLDPSASKIHHLMHASEELVLEHDAAGHYAATVLRPATMYGPRQIAPQEWSIVRRIRDRRPRMIVADGGLKVMGRIFTDNFAAALLRTIDRPEPSRGKRYNVRDRPLHTLRQWIKFVAEVLEWQFELVDLPYELAGPCYPLWMHNRHHRATSDELIRKDLSFVDSVPTDKALAATVKWLVDHPLAAGGEAEQQLGDPFDYEREDLLVARWEAARPSLESIDFALPAAAHRYRHPAEPGEAWRRPASDGLRIDQ